MVGRHNILVSLHNFERRTTDEKLQPTQVPTKLLPEFNKFLLDGNDILCPTFILFQQQRQLIRFEQLFSRLINTWHTGVDVIIIQSHNATRLENSPCYRTRLRSFRKPLDRGPPRTHSNHSAYILSPALVKSPTPHPSKN